MKFKIAVIHFMLCFLIVSCNQNNNTLRTASSGGYTYTYVDEDPMKVRIYQLKNGLTVYLSKYEAEPRIMTNIAVRAGGKNDPADATGLAHYLEHIMFKGTSDFGTINWDKEKILLDSVENLYETYRSLKDSIQRSNFYKKIDQVSFAASELALANEYDKIVSGIGAGSTNAYTMEDRTVYINDIPSNQIENWLKLESNRFRMIIPRLFHTELESVYEEKNRTLDNDYWKTFEAKNAALFPNHPYGTQTVIGTIEHLKNPSIKEIKKYFDTYYRPNNVAICMSGDLEYDQTISLIDQYFGQWESNQNLPVWEKPIEPAIQGPVIREVVGPDAEWVEVAFRFDGRNSTEYPLLLLTDLILSNSQAGLFDLNLRQAQKVLEPYSYISAMTDYSVHTLTARPRTGQSLDEVRGLLMEQIEKIKRGEFEDWLLPAIINDLKKQNLMSSENNFSRADAMVVAFTSGIPWNNQVNFLNQLKKINRNDVRKFVEEKYKDNQIVIYKRTGKGPKVQKIIKPEITPVSLNKEGKSQFHLSILESEVKPIAPVFLDFDRDLSREQLTSGIEMIGTQNSENELFSLYYLVDVGTDHDPISRIATQYLQYIGTSTKDAATIKKEFYKLGCSFGVFASDDQTYVYLSGLSENMIPAIKLFEDLLNDPKEDVEALQKMIDGVLKEREDLQKDKGNILWGGLVNYGLYGPESSYTHLLTNDQLKEIKASDLTSYIRRITGIQHRVLYYGPLGLDEVVGILNKEHRVPEKLMAPPEPRHFEMKDMDRPSVYWTNYDMVQAEIIFISKGQTFDPTIAPEATMFNEYFGGSMSSPVFQELRERRGLAYAAWSGYNRAGRKNKNDYLFAYIGTQADKQSESMSAMMNLMNNFPRTESGFEIARNAIVSRMSTERIIKENILFSYEAAKKQGLDRDLRKDIFEGVQGLTIEDVAGFHKRMIEGKKFNVVVIGDRNRLNFKALAGYGSVKELTTDDLFGFKKQPLVQLKDNQ